MKIMKILGYKYAVKRDIAANNSSWSAACNSKKMEIILPVDTERDQNMASAIIHETIEALDYHLELDLPHRAIMALEAGLYQVLVDNGVDLSPLLNGIDE